MGRAGVLTKRLGIPFIVVAMSAACDQNAKGSGPAGSSDVRAVSKGSGAEVLRSSAPKITEAAFFKALDAQLDVIFSEMRGKKYRSQMQLAFEIGARMQPQLMIRETSKRMGVTDVAVLSLFARQPEVRKKVGEHVKERVQKESEALKKTHEGLPKVVREDCREAAEKNLALKGAGDGKAAVDRRSAPMVGALLKECGATEQPELVCYAEAADAAGLKACDNP